MKSIIKQTPDADTTYTCTITDDNAENVAKTVNLKVFGKLILISLKNFREISYNKCLQQTQITCIIRN